MAQWKCIERCGACCYLEPRERPDLGEYLPPEDLQLYLSMVGPDGWCKNYDKTDRRCKIYSDRPWFCRVESKTFETMFEVSESELNEFAIDCCHEQISSVYGDRSLEMHRYQREVGLNIEMP